MPFLQPIVMHSKKKKERRKKALLIKMKLGSFVWDSSAIRQVVKTQHPAWVTKTSIEATIEANS